MVGTDSMGHTGELTHCCAVPGTPTAGAAPLDRTVQSSHRRDPTLYSRARYPTRPTPQHRLRRSREARSLPRNVQHSKQKVQRQHQQKRRPPPPEGDRKVREKTQQVRAPSLCTRFQRPLFPLPDTPATARRLSLLRASRSAIQLRPAIINEIHKNS